MENKENLEHQLEAALNYTINSFEGKDASNIDGVLIEGHRIYSRKLNELDLIKDETSVPSFSTKRKRKLILVSSIGVIYFGIIITPLILDVLRGQSTYISLVVYFIALGAYSFLVWSKFFKSPISQLKKALIKSNGKIKNLRLKGSKE